jgi:CheY-like chemotaxis protein
MFDEHDRRTGRERDIARPPIEPLLHGDSMAAVHGLPEPTWLRQPRRGRVLVIDDDPRISFSLELILSEWHDVISVNDPREALYRMRRGQRFDVILCDVMMPQLSAMDFYAALERDLPGTTSRVVFLTGGAFTPQAREFLARVPNPYFEKPVNIDRLIALVQLNVTLRSHEAE